ncbi:MAG TPA: BON domain-containing protein [Pyrinomonadaceae bacterium]|nr:BON domain-containing protein [Pyrinomonadaceae bacterium]
MSRIPICILISTLALILGGCSNASKPSSVGEKSEPMVVPRDIQISQDARRRLDTNGLRNVYVETENGEITLRGEVEDPNEILMAEESVKTVPGVVRVKNDIHVVASQRAMEKGINANKPGGPRREKRAINPGRPGGPRKEPTPF